MVEIRRAIPADAESILAHCKACGGESDNLTFGAEGVAFTVEQERAYLGGILNSDRQIYLVAMQADEVVATAQFSAYAKPRLAHRGEISIAVRRAMWGRGIGTRLMEELLRFARETAGVEVVSLEVRSDNARAIALYRRFGFETIGTFKGYMKINGQDVDCDYMRLHL